MGELYIAQGRADGQAQRWCPTHAATVGVGYARLQSGLQIASCPAGDDEGVRREYGFVISVSGAAAFCRYWRKGEPGVLRTTSCSELTPLEWLIPYDSVPQAQVDTLLRQIQEEQLRELDKRDL